jgi:hypothetical protein
LGATKIEWIDCEKNFSDLGINEIEFDLGNDKVLVN